MSVFNPIPVAEHGSGTGFWKRPNAKAEPELLALWLKMTSKAKSVLPSIVLNEPPLCAGDTPPAGESRMAPEAAALCHMYDARPFTQRSTCRTRRSHRARGHERSRNWSGAVVPAESGLEFNRVGGGWKAPANEGRFDATNAKPSQMSVWVGLGGARLWEKSLPQMGSEHGYDGNGLVDRLWVQWWLGESSGKAALSSWVQGIRCQAGDEILCMITVTAPQVVEFYFKNQTTGELAGVRGTGARPVIGASAEWVVERPTYLAYACNVPGAVEHGADPHALISNGLFALPKFEMVEMHDCAATLGDGASLRARTLADADVITMLGRRERPTRIYKAVVPWIVPVGTTGSLLRRSSHRVALAGDLALLVKQTTKAAPRA